MFNLWSCYRSANGEMGWTFYPGLENDLRTNPVSTYQDGLVNLYNANLISHNMRTLMDRTKITYLGYGARSDYQCESVAQNPDYWFYTYNYSANNNINIFDYIDNSVYGNGVKVKRCVPNPNLSPEENSNYVVKNLKCNREQVSMNGLQNGDWIDDYRHTWKVKPRIRIDPAVAHSTENPLVCRIEIMKWADIETELRHIDIRSNYFLDAQTGEYNGEYIEKYNLPQVSEKLEFGGDPNNDEMNPLHKRADDWNIPCNVDFRVFWYGNCDMWIDYVRVDNEVANDLFANPPNSNTILYNQWIHDEVVAANQRQGPLAFYMEEWEFNNLPCMKYISDKLKTMTENTNHYSLMADLNYGRMFYHIPPGNIYENGSNEGIAYVKKMFIDSLNQKQIFTGLYPISGWEQNGIGTSYIPNTLCGNVTYNIKAGMLTTSVEPAQYEWWLQGAFDNHYDLRYTQMMQIADKISKDKNIPFVNLVQTHLQYNPTEQRREPTNEEINLMVNLGLCYGAKSNLYFWYSNYGDFNAPDQGYSRGLTGSGSIHDDLPREYNVYGQRKWDAIAEIDNKLHIWGPYLMSFDNTNRHSYIYRIPDERTALNNNSYFSNFCTLKPGRGAPICNIGFTPDNVPTDFTYDCQDSTFLQVSTFENTEPLTKYFMVVNRRCSYYKDESSIENRGGKRIVRAYFHSNYPAFSDFRNWSIVNCENNNVERIFDKNNPGFIDFPNAFMPGEGRLYKIVPTMMTGGTLVCDENIQGSIFSCASPVIAYDKNITIGMGTQIDFGQNGSLTLNGGSFVCGNVSQTNIPRTALSPL